MPTPNLFLRAPITARCAKYLHHWLEDHFVAHTKLRPLVPS